MKVLLVNTRHFYGGGDSTYTFNLSNLLRNCGHETAFFAMQDSRNLPDPNEDLFVPSIDFRELVQKKTPSNGIRVVSRSIYSMESRLKFRRLLVGFHPDVVHLQSIHSHITLSILDETQQQGIPVVWTLHDYRTICPNTHFLNDQTGEICEECQGGHFYRAVIKRCKKGSRLASGIAAFESYYDRWTGAFKKVEAFLTPSQFLKDKLAENGFDENRVYHLPLFLPLEKFNEGETDQGYLLFLGRLETIKGIQVLIEAARKAKNVSVIIAGSVSEPLASRLPDLLPENACYAGLLHGQELTDITRNALAVVIPSIWYENQPFSILEAFAMGKPVIASNLGGMTELVIHRERGLLIKPGDQDALADAMVWAVNNRRRLKEMGRNARQYALAVHSPEKHYQSLMDIYAQISAVKTR